MPVLDRPRRRCSALLLSLRWRRQRFVVRRRRLLVGALSLVFAAGVLYGNAFRAWTERTVFSGHARVRGQVLVRPLVGPAVVRGVTVRLLPQGRSDPFAAFFTRAQALSVGADHAGRWEAPAVRRGWHYAVVLEAEGCPPRLAGAVDVGWFAGARLETVIASCLSEPYRPRCG